MKRGFTLIELLIVVAIIAILAAIAVPNFLEAQTRSKVSRVKADLRSAGTALEAYAVDHNGNYPHLQGHKDAGTSGVMWGGGIGVLTPLTTPVAYLTSVMLMDPFANVGNYSQYGITNITASGNYIFVTLNYLNVKLTRLTVSGASMDNRPRWFLMSYGPDYEKGPNPYTGAAWSIQNYATSNLDPTHRFEAWNYDPSNGTTSKGDIIRHQ